MLKAEANNILLQDYQTEVIGRADENSRLNESVLKPLLELNKPPLPVYIYGGTGSGKTLLVKQILQKNTKKIKQLIPTFDYLYVNMKNESIPSKHCLYSKIVSYLQKYLPIKSERFGRVVDYIPAKGWNSGDYQNIIREIIKEKRLCFLLVIDEIDKIINREKDDGLIYSLMEETNNFSGFVGMSSVMISNDVMLLNKITEPTRTRIPTTMFFKPYGYQEIFQILKHFANLSLKEGVYTEDCVSKISREITKISHSIREAKRLLYYTATLSKEKLQPEKFELAKLEVTKDMLFRQVMELPIHSRIVLKALTKQYEKIENAIESSDYIRKNYKFKTEYQPSMGAIYKIYKELSSRFSQTPYSYVWFYNAVRSMSKDSVLRTEVTSLGRARGITTLLHPPIDVSVFRDIIDKSLEWLE